MKTIINGLRRCGGMCGYQKLLRRVIKVTNLDSLYKKLRSPHKIPILF